MATNGQVKLRKQRLSAKLKVLFRFKSSLETGETISTAPITQDPSGLTIASPTISGSDVIGLLDASSSTVGTTHRVTCTANTSDSQKVPAVIDVEIIAD